MPDAQLNRGLVIDVLVGESIVIEPTTGQQQIVLTMETKHGQRGRLRVRSDHPVHVFRPEKCKADI